MKVGNILEKSKRLFPIKDLKKEDLLHLRDIFKSSGYTEENIVRKLEVGDMDQIMLKHMPYYLKFCMADDTPLDFLIRLFKFAQPLEVSKAQKLFGKDYLNFLVDISLLEKREDKVYSKVDIYPCMGMYFATDHSYTHFYSFRHVYPLGMDSYILARGMLREPVDSTLDLCTGSGVQGILASSFSKKVTLVDVNLRALNFAQFNALLNQRDNIEFRLGDLYDVVEGEKFDFILANPPFVPSPEKTVFFRDGSITGENVLSRIIKGIPYFLRKKGKAQIVTLLVFTKKNYVDKVKEWLSVEEFDIFILKGLETAVLPYISSHLDFSGDFKDYFFQMERWVKAYREAGITGVADGLINIKYGTGVTQMEIFKPILSPFAYVIDRWFKYTQTPSFGKVKLGKHIDSLWHGIKENGENLYGVTYKDDFLYFEKNLDEEEWIFLKEIINGNKKSSLPPSKILRLLKSFVLDEV